MTSQDNQRCCEKCLAGTIQISTEGFKEAVVGYCDDWDCTCHRSESEKHGEHCPCDNCRAFYRQTPSKEEGESVNDGRLSGKEIISQEKCECGLPLGHDYDHRDIGPIPPKSWEENFDRQELACCAGCTDCEGAAKRAKDFIKDLLHQAEERGRTEGYILGAKEARALEKARWVEVIKEMKETGLIKTFDQT